MTQQGAEQHVPLLAPPPPLATVGLPPPTSVSRGQSASGNAPSEDRQQQQYAEQHHYNDRNSVADAEAVTMAMPTEGPKFAQLDAGAAASEVLEVRALRLQFRYPELEEVYQRQMALSLSARSFVWTSFPLIMVNFLLALASYYNSGRFLVFFVAAGLVQLLWAVSRPLVTHPRLAALVNFLACTGYMICMTTEALFLVRSGGGNPGDKPITLQPYAQEGSQLELGIAIFVVLVPVTTFRVQLVWYRWAVLTWFVYYACMAFIAYPMPKEAKNDLIIWLVLASILSLVCAYRLELLVRMFWYFSSGAGSLAPMPSSSSSARLGCCTRIFVCCATGDCSHCYGGDSSADTRRTDAIIGIDAEDEDQEGGDGKRRLPGRQGRRRGLFAVCASALCCCRCRGARVRGVDDGTQMSKDNTPAGSDVYHPHGGDGHSGSHNGSGTYDGGNTPGMDNGPRSRRGSDGRIGLQTPLQRCLDIIAAVSNNNSGSHGHGHLTATDKKLLAQLTTILTSTPDLNEVDVTSVFGSNKSPSHVHNGGGGSSIGLKRRTSAAASAGVGGVRNGIASPGHGPNGEAFALTINANLHGGGHGGSLVGLRRASVSGQGGDGVHGSESSGFASPMAGEDVASQLDDNTRQWVASELASRRARYATSSKRSNPGNSSLVRTIASIDSFVVKDGRVVTKSTNSMLGGTNGYSTPGHGRSGVHLGHGPAFSTNSSSGIDMSTSVRNINMSSTTNMMNIGSSITMVSGGGSNNHNNSIVMGTPSMAALLESVGYTQVDETPSMGGGGGGAQHHMGSPISPFTHQRGSLSGKRTPGATGATGAGGNSSEHAMVTAEDALASATHSAGALTQSSIGGGGRRGDRSFEPITEEETDSASASAANAVVTADHSASVGGAGVGGDSRSVRSTRTPVTDMEDEDHHRRSHHHHQQQQHQGADEHHNFHGLETGSSSSSSSSHDKHNRSSMLTSSGTSLARISSVRTDASMMLFAGSDSGKNIMFEGSGTTASSPGDTVGGGSSSLRRSPSSSSNRHVMSSSSANLATLRYNQSRSRSSTASGASRRGLAGAGTSSTGNVSRVGSLARIPSSGARVQGGSDVMRSPHANAGDAEEAAAALEEAEAHADALPIGSLPQEAFVTSASPTVTLATNGSTERERTRDNPADPIGGAADTNRSRDNDRSSEHSIVVVSAAPSEHAAGSPATVFSGASQRTHTSVSDAASQYSTKSGGDRNNVGGNPFVTATPRRVSAESGGKAQAHSSSAAVSSPAAAAAAVAAGAGPSGATSGPNPAQPHATGSSGGGGGLMGFIRRASASAGVLKPMIGATATVAPASAPAAAAASSPAAPSTAAQASVAVAPHPAVAAIINGGGTGNGGSGNYYVNPRGLANMGLVQQGTGSEGPSGSSTIIADPPVQSEEWLASRLSAVARLREGTTAAAAAASGGAASGQTGLSHLHTSDLNDVTGLLPTPANDSSRQANSTSSSSSASAAAGTHSAHAQGTQQGSSAGNTQGAGVAASPAPKQTPASQSSATPAAASNVAHFSTPPPGKRSSVIVINSGGPNTSSSKVPPSGAGVSATSRRGSLPGSYAPGTGANASVAAGINKAKTPLSGPASSALTAPGSSSGAAMHPMTSGGSSVAPLVPRDRDVVERLRIVTQWDFDVFEFTHNTDGRPLAFISYELFSRFHFFAPAWMQQQFMQSDGSVDALAAIAGVSSGGVGGTTGNNGNSNNISNHHSASSNGSLNIPEATFTSFINKIERDYCFDPEQPNPYHTNVHAADVVQAVGAFLVSATVHPLLVAMAIATSRGCALWIIHSAPALCPLPRPHVTFHCRVMCATLP